ncbi:hypothetical protein BCT07_16125 [Vibrio breoganii]|nr:hypothetical protein BCT07_16125 [Vibrio breoganii]
MVLRFCGRLPSSSSASIEDLNSSIVPKLKRSSIKHFEDDGGLETMVGLVRRKVKLRFYAFSSSSSSASIEDLNSAAVGEVFDKTLRRRRWVLDDVGSESTVWLEITRASY